MAKFSEQRIGVLVDISNLYYSARVLYGKKVNFKNVLEAATDDRKLIRAIAYGITTTEATEEKFFEALEKSGYEVKTKDLQIFPDGSKKGDWDVGIAVDAIKMAAKLDVVVIVSGDGDYVSLVEYIQNTHGCRVEVIAFAESASAKLVDIADDFTNLSENKRRFLI
ncbi:MAG: NYN domain-containing protein [Candidatus Moranbacteria bacterium]|nr:NYN domain-containing protein [Candidatus Moranbacteria bacterium]